MPVLSLDSCHGWVVSTGGAGEGLQPIQQNAAYNQYSVCADSAEPTRPLEGVVGCRQLVKAALKLSA